MSYYTNLINAWNNVTQPPTGVTGTGLSSNDTTAQKLAKVQAWTITGSIPTLAPFNGKDILNALDSTEFIANTATQQANIIAICDAAQVWGGSSSFVGKYFATVYSTRLAGPTITALSALATAAVTPWWQSNGYTSQISNNDLVAAGGLT